MPQKSTLSFKNWAFEINQKLTQNIYTNILCGKANLLGDKISKLYSEKRADYFPDEIINLFQDLGIDYTKENKITHKLLENSQNAFEGSFQFIGNLIKGPSCKIELNKDHVIYELTPINENFSIGFHQDSAPFFNLHVIHVEFLISDLIAQSSRSKNY